MQKISAKRLCRAGVIAALYAVLTYAFAPVAFGAIQIRPAEALCILPLFFIEAVPALYVGCMLSNLLSPFFVYDVFVGSLATLFAGICTYQIRKTRISTPWKIFLGGIFPVLFNTVLIPYIIVFLCGDIGAFETVAIAYFTNAFFIFISESLCVYGLGSPLYYMLTKILKGKGETSAKNLEIDENICYTNEKGVTSMDYNKIVSLVYDARKIVFSKDLKTQEKNANPYDFVTAVDTGISDFMKEELFRLYPEVGFMTEEESDHTLKNKSFILDPIDGTTNLVYDYKMSSISLAYVEENQVVFGVVFNPFTNELFFAVKGKGAHLYTTENGIEELLKIGVENYAKNPLSVSKRELKKSLIEFGAGSSRKGEAQETFTRAQRVFENCLDLRRICSTAIAISYIAAGRLDGYFEKVIKPWDYAAGILILEESGGISSDWDGNPLPLDRPSTILCSNGANYETLKDLILQ